MKYSLVHILPLHFSSPSTRCVYFDLAMKDWVGPSEICQVTNDLDLGVDDYVDCSCNHLSQYAVKAVVDDYGIVGYSVWFFIACFICMVSDLELDLYI